MQRAFYGGITALALSAMTAVPANAGPLIDSSRSGLPWASGALTTPIQIAPAFEEWRGRPLDFRTIFLAYTTWPNMTASARALRPQLASGARIVVSVGMLASTHAGQLAACGTGALDPQIKGVVDTLLSHGASDAHAAGKPVIVRLGWEANNTNGAFPWRVNDNGTNWRACFRRWVSILNPIVAGQRQKRFLVVWNMANKGTFNYPIANIWPGNDVVDIVGSEYYDRCPPLPAFSAGWTVPDPEWTRRLNARTREGNPAGPATWLAFAKSKSKPYAIPEWGTGGPRTINCGPKAGPEAQGRDNPYFMQRMYQFLYANRADLAFESYFNGHGAPSDTDGSHKLFAPDPLYPPADDPDYLAYSTRYLPESAATYRELWGSGIAPPLP